MASHPNSLLGEATPDNGGHDDYAGFVGPVPSCLNEWEVKTNHFVLHLRWTAVFFNKNYSLWFRHLLIQTPQTISVHFC